MVKRTLRRRSQPQPVMIKAAAGGKMIAMMTRRTSEALTMVGELCTLLTAAVLRLCMPEWCTAPTLPLRASCIIPRDDSCSNPLLPPAVELHPRIIAHVLRPPSTSSLSSGNIISSPPKSSYVVPNTLSPSDCLIGTETFLSSY